jgi:5'-methylthioadenosine phosphorylase
MASIPAYPAIPDDIAAQPKYAVIGGSGVTVAGEERFSFKTPLGYLINISFLDEAKRVVFVNRHLCTAMDAEGKATYAPPHAVDFHVIMIGLKKLNVKSVCAIGSTGSLRPDEVPVGSIVMPDDYAFVLPAPVTFWGKLPMGAFAPEFTQEGKIHFAPASADDKQWVSFRQWVQQTLHPVLAAHQGKIKLAPGQEGVWPCVGSTEVGNDVKVAYVQTSGPRFETRAEIQVYKNLGHVVGMTCSAEWTLAQVCVRAIVAVCQTSVRHTLAHAASGLFAPPLASLLASRSCSVLVSCACAGAGTVCGVKLLGTSDCLPASRITSNP